MKKMTERQAGQGNVPVMKRQGQAAASAIQFSLTDLATGNTDGTLTKGRNAEIKGTYLKVVGDDPACGITFTNKETKAVTKLAADEIALNEPSRLLILVPATLAAGEYELTVTTQFTGGNTLLKNPRSVLFGPVVIS